MKVIYSKDAPVERIENNLLLKVLNDALETMSHEQLKEHAESVGSRNSLS